MRRYLYATVDATTFLTSVKVPPPGPDAYLAQDEPTEALRSLLDNGYRFRMVDATTHLALFEKELPPAEPSFKKQRTQTNEKH